MLFSLAPPTSATGHLAAPHFRGRAKRGRPYTTRKWSKRQKVHLLGGFFCFSPKMPLNQTSPEGAGWDEELSNIDPQAVYHTAWGDFGNKKAGLHENAKRFLPQRPWITENKRQCMRLSPFALSFSPRFLVFAQDAIAARPLREQVGMKNCRTSAREAYTIR